jgi:hypothetical protein
MGKQIDVVGERRRLRDESHQQMAERAVRDTEERAALMRRIGQYTFGTNVRWPGSPLTIDEWIDFVSGMDGKGPRFSRDVKLTWEQVEVLVRTAYANGKNSCSEF